jgi:diketogulonate reductase-like aldo/keto reductase
MQIHNLVDWRIHLPTLREWKTQGRIRYVGVTHYSASAYDELERVLRHETLDFVQLNYSLEERTAEKRLLPLAADRGVAVIVNLPFGAGRMLGRLRDKHILPRADEYGCESWAQLLLKFILSHKAVTCVIPGTGNARHMIENCRAGMGGFFDARQCDDLRKFWDDKCSEFSNECSGNDY